MCGTKLTGFHDAACLSPVEESAFLAAGKLVVYLVGLDDYVDYVVSVYHEDYKVPELWNGHREP